jgi:hypothetical protein
MCHEYGLNFVCNVSDGFLCGQVSSDVCFHYSGLFFVSSIFAFYLCYSNIVCVNIVLQSCLKVFIPSFELSQLGKQSHTMRFDDFVKCF